MYTLPADNPPDCRVYIVRVWASRVVSSETLANADGPSHAIPQRPAPRIETSLLAHDPLADETTTVIVPHLVLKPSIDLVDLVDPRPPRLGGAVVFVGKVSAERNVRAGDDIARLDIHAAGPGHIEHVPAQVVVRVPVIPRSPIVRARANGRGRNDFLPRGGEERERECGEVVRQKRLHQASPVRVRVARYLGH